MNDTETLNRKWASERGELLIKIWKQLYRGGFTPNIMGLKKCIRLAKKARA